MDPEEQWTTAIGLFPQHETARYIPTTNEDFVPIDTLELLAAGNKLQVGKCPGPDNIPVEVAILLCIYFTEDL